MTDEQILNNGAYIVKWESTMMTFTLCLLLATLQLFKYAPISMDYSHTLWWEIVAVCMAIVYVIRAYCTVRSIMLMYGGIRLVKQHNDRIYHSHG